MKLKDIDSQKKKFGDENLPTSREIPPQWTPYDRYLNLSEQVKTWRRITLFSCIITLFSVGIGMYKTLSSPFVPYIVKIDKNSSDIVSTTLLSKVTKQADDSEIEFFTTNVFDKVYTIYRDRQYYQKIVEKALPFFNQNAFNKLQNSMLNTLKTVYGDGGTSTITITNFLHVDQGKYQMQYKVVEYDGDGVQKAEHNFTVIISIVQSPVNTVKEIRTNPLGITITDLEIRESRG